MAGRPRKSVDASVAKRGKKEKINRKIQEEKLKIDRDQLIAPDFLDELGKEEFYRVVYETDKIDVLDNLDLSILAMYCNAYSQYIEVNEQIRNTMPALRYNDKGRSSPLINVQDKLVKQILSFSSKLGLATTDRLKLMVPNELAENKENKFIKYVV